jgi:hypothetical protein
MNPEQSAALENAALTPKQRAFLAAYGRCARIGQAAETAKIAKQSHYIWLSESENYRNAFAQTQIMIGDLAEDAAVERAIHGVEKPVLYQGRPVRVNGKLLYEREYSDTLLIQLLRRFKPQEYRERTTMEVSGSVDLVERLQAGRRRVLEMRARDAEQGLA